MRRIFLTILLTTWLSGAAADIYKRIDEHGVVHLSDRPMGKGSVLIIRDKKKVKPAVSGDFTRNRRRFTPMIEGIAARLRLDKHLVHALITAESAYDPNAKSRAGAVGLMQLMPDTASRYGVKDRYDPRQNVFGGMLYLRDLMFQFRDVVLAIAAYNAGENAVLKYGSQVPPYAETQTFVRLVLGFYRDYREAS